MDVLLFHHAQGLTPGVEEFADLLRAGGHRVTIPDLYGGETFTSIDDGVAHAEQIGLGVVAELGAACAQDLSDQFVVAGFSLGVLPAQKLAQNNPLVRGALLYHGGVGVEVFGGSWPAVVSAQIHICEDDEWAEPDVVRALGDTIADCDLHVYPGSAHLVTDSSLPEFDPELRQLILERSLQFLR